MSMICGVAPKEIVHVTDVLSGMRDPGYTSTSPAGVQGSEKQRKIDPRMLAGLVLVYIFGARKGGDTRETPRVRTVATLWCFDGFDHELVARQLHDAPLVHSYVFWGRATAV